MQGGLTYRDSLGVPHPTHQLTEWTGCGFNDPGHDDNPGPRPVRRRRHGRLHQERQRQRRRRAGYFSRSQLPTNAALVDKFVICDNWFCSILSPTFPNRFYTHAAQTDRIDNSLTQQSFLPTIWDRPAAAGVSANYSFSDERRAVLGGEVSQVFDVAQRVGGPLRGRSAGSVMRPPGVVRGWTFTSQPREKTFTNCRSARTSTWVPIRSPGTE
jgi:hypothetical protein